ncbi:uncharacterized [Tachysurus ichikawai]
MLRHVPGVIINLSIHLNNVLQNHRLHWNRASQALRVQTRKKGGWLDYVSILSATNNESLSAQLILSNTTHEEAGYAAATPAFSEYIQMFVSSYCQGT